VPFELRRQADRREGGSVLGNEAALRTRLKGDPAKVALAARLRAETTMTAGWIAERLEMGSRGYLNHLLYHQRKSGRK